MKRFNRGHDEVSAQLRLDDDLKLQAAIVHLWHCGPSTFGEAVAGMLDGFGVPATVFDALLPWVTIDPQTCHWGFDAPPRRRRKPAKHLHLVPPAPEPGSES